jgi:hypothetical protein
MTNASPTPTPPAAEGKSRSWLIIVIVVVVLCCLVAVCLGAGWYAWTYGDSWIQLGRVASTALG